MNIFTTFEFTEDNINELFIKLINIYPIYFQEPDRIREIIELFKLEHSNNITLIIESNHVDRQYRDSYYSYFSQKYSSFERNCLRLAFFEGNIKYSDFMSDISEIQQHAFLGTIVLRPLNVGNIGHTLLNPNKLKIVGYVQTSTFKVMICGRKFKLKAFPYSSQDNETMTCAETALFNLIQYYSQKYSEYRLLMPNEILKIIEQVSYGRVLPSNGVDDACMTKVLQTAHLHPILYRFENEEDLDFDELFYAYVESGIPFIFGLPQHAVICIGHGAVDFKITHHNLEDISVCEDIEGHNIYYLNTARLVDDYIFMDDNRAPYFISTIDKLTEYYYENSNYAFESDDVFDDENKFPDDGDDIFEANVEYPQDIIKKMKRQCDCLIVPLYKRIFLDASRAKSIFDLHFLKNIDFIHKIQEAYDDKTWGCNFENPLVWRMYLASSNSFKDFKCRYVNNGDMYEYYSGEAYPRFVWVLEIGTVSTFSVRKARVEILLDATSSRNSDTWAILSVVYKGHAVFVPHVINKMRKLQDVRKKISEKNSVSDEDYSSINLEEIGEDVRENILTEIFKSLYYNSNKFVDDIYEIYSNSNLKEI